MSVQPKSKSFFSTTAGALTGIAGVLTAVVGILGAATQLGWIGGSNDESPASTTTTAGPTQTTLNPGVGGLLTTTTTPPASFSPGATSATAQFNVTPGEVNFTTSREALVRVENIGRNAITFEPPTIAGANPRNFTATPVDASCGRLEAGRSCQLRVTFVPSGPGQYTAVLVVKPAGAPAREVSLKASALI